MLRRRNDAKKERSVLMAGWDQRRFAEEAPDRVVVVERMGAKCPNTDAPGRLEERIAEQGANPAALQCVVNDEGDLGDARIEPVTNEARYADDLTWPPSRSRSGERTRERRHERDVIVSVDVREVVPLVGRQIGHGRVEALEPRPG
jgi:hypothetical protein